VKEKKFIGAWHSLTKVGLGESDLALKFKATHKKNILMLIENKIDVEFMHEQAQRYLKRGEEYLKDNECDEFFAVLIAPEKYLLKGNEFSQSISYESICSWFAAQKDFRSTYKAELFRIAIEKQRRGYSAIPDDQVTTWQHQYYELAMNLFPELKMRKPPEKIPKGSGFLYFTSPEIEKIRAAIVHKTGRRNFERKPDAKQQVASVDLQFYGLAKEVDKLNKKYSAVLTNEMKFVKAHKSAALRIEIPSVNTRASVEEQKPTLILALQKAKVLYEWALKNYQK
jgi:hypothetical protein